MENIIKKTISVRSSVRGLVIVAVASLCVALVLSVASMAIAGRQVNAAQNRVYVLDRGSAAVATAGAVSDYRELEARDHVVRLHELLFNLSPSAEAIQANVDRALLLSDRSVYNYWKDQSEKDFYRRLVSANISQQFSLDSVSVNTGIYPYQARLWGKFYLIRQSNITSYRMSTSCQLVETTRSPSNPHGLMVERFAVESTEKIGTRSRQ